MREAGELRARLPQSHSAHQEQSWVSTWSCTEVPRPGPKGRHTETRTGCQRPQERQPGRDPKAEENRWRFMGRSAQKGETDRYTQRDRDDLALEETEIRTHRGRTADTKRHPPTHHTHTQELER